MVSEAARIVGALAALLTAAAADAQPGLSFPVIGIGGGQVARLNVLNLAAAGRRATSTCTVGMQFKDANGQALKQSSVAVAAGQSVFLELKQVDVPGAPPRAEIQAILLFGVTGGAAPPTVSPTDCGNLFPSLEIYESGTGKTSLVVTATKELGPPALLPQ